MARPGSLGSVIDGGTDTARLIAAATKREAARRQVRRAKALRYLTRLGLADGDDSVAAALGLIEAQPVARCPSLHQDGRAQRTRDCGQCGKPFSAANPTQKTCSRSCGRKFQTGRQAALRAELATAVAAQVLDEEEP